MRAGPNLAFLISSVGRKYLQPSSLLPTEQKLDETMPVPWNGMSSGWPSISCSVAVKPPPTPTAQARRPSKTSWLGSKSVNYCSEPTVLEIAHYKRALAQGGGHSGLSSRTERRGTNYANPLSVWLRRDNHPGMPFVASFPVGGQAFTIASL
jgi:hypothetical protein